MALMVGVPVILNIPVPFSRIGSSMVNCASALFSLSTLKACPSFKAVNISTEPLREADTTEDCALMIVLMSVAI